MVTSVAEHMNNYEGLNNYDLIISLRFVWIVLPTLVVARVKALGLRRHRGCRAGKAHRLLRNQRPIISAVVGRYRDRRAGKIRSVERHAGHAKLSLTFGCLNIRSLNNKLDDLLEVRRDQLIDVLLLCETWHDTDSVALSRLRTEGFQVIDRPRPRLCCDTLATNHGGVAAVAAPGLKLQRLEIGFDPASFELVCVRVRSQSLSCIVAVVYRPGSVAASTEFFADFTDVLGRLVTFAEPIYIVGDINIHLERPDDSAACEICDIFTAHACQTASHHLLIILADCWMSLSVEVTCRLTALMLSMSDSLIIIFCVGQSRWSVKTRSTSRHRIVHGSTSTQPTSDQPSSHRCSVTLGRGLHSMSTNSLSCTTLNSHRFLTVLFPSEQSSVVDARPTPGSTMIVVLKSEASGCLSVTFDK